MLDSPPSPAMLSWLQRRQAPDAPPELAPDMPGEKPTSPMIPDAPVQAADPTPAPAPVLAAPAMPAMPSPGEMVQKLQAAQAADAEARKSLASEAGWSSFLGHKISPETILRLREPHAAADLIAQPGFRESTAKAANDEAEMPYAASNAKSKADLTAAHAAQFQQLATSGASKAEFENSLRQGIESDDPATAALIKGQAKNLMPGMADMIDKAPTRLVYGMLDQFQKTHGQDILNDRSLEIARIAAEARVKASGLGGGGPQMTDDATKQAAEFFIKNGKLPNTIPSGKQGAPIRTKIANYVAQNYPGVDVTSVAAETHANSTSLNGQQKLLDLTQSWESTGKANLGVLREVSGELANAGSPLANKPLRWIYQNVAGDPTVTKFKAAHAAVVNEYAKILSGNTGGGGVTEGARHEAESMMPLDSTPAQIAAAADVLEKDAGNRLGALTAQRDATKGRLSAKPVGDKPPVAGAFKTKSGKWAVKDASGVAHYVDEK